MSLKQNIALTLAATLLMVVTACHKRPAPAPLKPAAQKPTVAPTPAPNIQKIVGKEFDYTVQKKDSLRSLAARLGEDDSIIAQANSLKRHTRIKPGQIIHIDNRHIVPAAILP